MWCGSVCFLCKWLFEHWFVGDEDSYRRGQKLEDQTIHSPSWRGYPRMYLADGEDMVDTRRVLGVTVPPPARKSPPVG